MVVEPDRSERREAAPLVGAAAVLAGGRSRRMGRDKALLLVDGQTLLERALTHLGEFCEQLLVSVPHAGPSPEVERVLEAVQGRGFAVHVVPDRRPGAHGPLAGIEAVLGEVEDRASFFQAVDLPAVDRGLVEALWTAAGYGGRLGAVPCWRGGLEPTCAVYHRDLVKVVSRLLDAGERRLDQLAALRGVCLLELESGSVAATGSKAPCVVASYSPRLEPKVLFRNLNSPSEYREFLRKG